MNFQRLLQALQKELTFSTPFRLCIAGGAAAHALDLQAGLSPRPLKDIDIFPVARRLPKGYNPKEARHNLRLIERRAVAAGWVREGGETDFYQNALTYSHPQRPGLQLVLRCEGMQHPQHLLNCFDIPEHKCAVFADQFKVDLRHRGWFNHPYLNEHGVRTHAERVLRAVSYGYYVERILVTAAQLTRDLSRETGLSNQMYAVKLGGERAVRVRFFAGGEQQGEFVLYPGGRLEEVSGDVLGRCANVLNASPALSWQPAAPLGVPAAPTAEFLPW